MGGLGAEALVGASILPLVPSTEKKGGALLLPEESSDLYPFELQPVTYGLENNDKTPFNADGRTPLSDYLYQLE